MNKVIIVGNNTKEIELKKTNSGKSVCEFTVAVNKKKADGSTSAETANTQFLVPFRKVQELIDVARANKNKGVS